MTTIFTVPEGSSRFRALPISASSVEACCTEMPGAKRTEIISIDSSISGKNVAGSRVAPQMLVATNAAEAAMTIQRRSTTRLNRLA